MGAPGSGTPHAVHRHPASTGSSLTAQADHPAKFSDEILGLLRVILGAGHLDHPGPILDPMAGLGRLSELGLPVILGELQLKWARRCPRPAYVADAARLPFRANSFWLVASSPTYGSRMADKYAGDGTARYTYTISHGEPLHPQNTGGMQWGQAYKDKNADILWDIYRVLKPGGCFILNVSDHYRRGRRQKVCAWWIRTAQETGFIPVQGYRVHTKRMRNGANSELRVPYEMVFVLQKPGE